MKPSGWLYLAMACVAVLGLFVAWPFLIVGTALGIGAYKQRQAERRDAVRARYAHTRK